MTIDKQNIYLKALEIGYSLGDEGISLIELKKILINLEYVFIDDLFRDWYYRTFEHKNRVAFINQPVLGVPESEDVVKFRLSSDSLFQYLEYVELKEARANSVSAKNQANNAFYTALLSLVVSLATLAISNYFPQSVSDDKVQRQLKELNKIILENQIQENLLYESHQHNIQPPESESIQVDPKTYIKEN